jgi:hypothetical protein
MLRPIPAGRGLLVAIFATGHSSIGTPTPLYVSRLLQIALAQPGVDGVLEYALKSPGGAACRDPPLYTSLPRETQLGCIVEHTFQANVHDASQLPLDDLGRLEEYD